MSTRAVWLPVAWSFFPIQPGFDLPTDHLSDDVITHTHIEDRPQGEPAGTLRSRPSLPPVSYPNAPPCASDTHHAFSCLCLLVM